MSRLSKALLAALALHGALLLVHARRGRPQSQPTRAPEELVVVEEAVDNEPARTSPSEQESANGVAEMARPAPAARAAAREVVASAVGTGEPTATDPGGTEDTGAVAAAGPGEGVPSTSTGKPERKIDFGIDDGFFMRPSTEPMPRQKKPVYMQQLQDALSADDVRRGLARGNAFLGSLNAAVRDVGPVRGEALLSVTVGADGSLSSAELLRGEASDWSSALASFRALAASKKLRVPPGARGLRVTFSILAKVQRPSGKEIDASGTDIEPNGTVRHTFDVSDLGSGTQRLVYAHIVSEEVL